MVMKKQISLLFYQTTEKTKKMAAALQTLSFLSFHVDNQ
ncbi:hypothetical protein CU011_1165 [Enterococcus faecium]|nr:hypothetical protein EfmE1636_1786 [Enterococcus faecium E1636]EFF31870.1 hypothetical protein EfmE1039_1521 [Enterococcus faecium E1039]MBK4753204.1 hypothetical protein [Enterococcus faecium]MBK4777533.1 hypothetical protein [Enterococcus faecium]MBK4806410.1 hypothetical protein [Enterococcus faecium]